MSLNQNSIIEILDDYLVWEEKKVEPMSILEAK